eukprot:2263712-Prorocentrum_lima.AAC.1
MTSSLVGSEMCIRDRPCNVQAPAPLSWGSGLGKLNNGRMLSHGPHAVSYTHLTLPTICSV